MTLQLPYLTGHCEITDVRMSARRIVGTFDRLCPELAVVRHGPGGYYRTLTVAANSLR